jgi:hypothetical protein
MRLVCNELFLMALGEQKIMFREAPRVALDPFPIAPHADDRESDFSSLARVVGEHEARALGRIVAVKNHVGVKIRHSVQLVGACDLSVAIVQSP